MARRSRYSLAARLNTQQSFLVILTIIAILLLISGQIYKNLYDGFRGGVMAITAPLINAVNAPFRVADNIGDNLGNYQELQQKHEILQFEMRQARYWEAYAKKLFAENQLLQQRWNLTDDIPKLPGNFYVARVIADLSGTFINSFIINSGKNSNIHENDIALDNGALIGRIIDSKNNYARILLLTDINSRIPIIVGPERLRAIMAGNNSNTTDLLFLAIDSIVETGMKVYTSGHGGVFPAGLPIGEIVDISEDGIKVLPIATPHQLEYVDILSFGAKLIPDENSTTITENYQEKQN